LHEFCARNFFVWTLIAQIYNIVICHDLSQKTKAISKINLYLKYAVLIAIVVQILEGVSKGLSWFNFNGHDGKDKGKFLEWTMTVTVISMFISIGMDARNFQYSYE